MLLAQAFTVLPVVADYINTKASELHLIVDACPVVYGILTSVVKDGFHSRFMTQLRVKFFIMNFGLQ